MSVDTYHMRPPRRPSLRFLLSHPAHLIAFGFGSGLSRFGPGTLGTLVAIPIFAIAPLLVGRIPIAALGVAVQATAGYKSSIAVIGEIPNTLATIPMTPFEN